MKELVTVVIPISEAALTPTESHCLLTYQEFLSGFPMTFLCPPSLKKSEVHQKICPDADFVSCDERYFQSAGGIAKLLLDPDLYEQFSWSRYLLVANLTTKITKNELAYWCRQGYDLVQQVPPFEEKKTTKDRLTRRINPTGYLETYKTESREYDERAGFSLRKVEAMSKLLKKKKRSIYHFFSSNPGVHHDALFWEYYTNRWTPDLITPNAISRSRFANSEPFEPNSELPFAITGVGNSAMK